MRREASTTLDAIARLFPRFAKLAASRDPEHVLPPATAAEVEAIEARTGVPLPDSYKQLLRITRGFWLMGGVVQFGEQHPFFHRFPALESLTRQQRSVVAVKGGPWPPASEGMLCFAEFFMEADGDQVLFDVARGLVNGEYPVMYWTHEGRPPSVRKLADSFAQFMEEYLSSGAPERGRVKLSSRRLQERGTPRPCTESQDVSGSGRRPVERWPGSGRSRPWSAGRLL